MYISLTKAVAFIILLCLLQACSTQYIDKKKNTKSDSLNNTFHSKVFFEISDIFEKNNPDCIIVLPIKTSINKKKLLIAKTDKYVDNILRKSFYAHISTLNYRDTELIRVDYLIKKNNYKTLNDYKLLSKKLQCNSFFEIEIIEYSYKYLGIYSSININLKAKLIAASSLEQLWEASIIESKLKGSIPLSPISIASGLYSAANNLREESFYSIADNVSRKILKTLPEPDLDYINTNLNLFDINNSTNEILKDDFILTYDTHDNYQIYISKKKFNFEEFDKIYKSLNIKKGYNKKTTLNYSELLYKNGYYEQAINHITGYSLSNKVAADIYFLKAKIYLKMESLDKAEVYFIKSISQKPTSAIFYNALGVLYIKKNNIASANAAFKMALNNIPDNVHANKMLGIINFNIKNYEDAVYYLSNVAIKSYEKNDYENLSKMIIILNKIKNIDPLIINQEFMNKLYYALEKRNKK